MTGEAVTGSPVAADAERLRADVVVLGAGPGGTAAAITAAREGADVVILDRAGQPAPHLPETWEGTTADLLGDLGVTDLDDVLMPEYAVRFVSPDGAHRVTVRVTVEGPAPPPLGRLDRSALDAKLVDAAQASGVRYLPGHSVTGVDLDVDHVRAHFEGPTSSAGVVRADVVVDATGKAALLARRYGLLRAGAELDPRTAVFSHFVLESDSALTATSTMSIVPVPGGYLFAIPMIGRRVSVGAVLGRAASGAYGDSQELLQAVIASAPVLAGPLEGARQLLPAIPAINRASAVTEAAGSRFVLVGDAAGFADPFLHRGVDVALESGVRAGRLATRLSATREANPARCAEFAREYDAWLVARRARAHGTTPRPGRQAMDWTAAVTAALADPHLPSFLPLAGLLGSVARPEPDVSPDAFTDCLAEARKAFSSW